MSSCKRMQLSVQVAETSNRCHYFFWASFLKMSTHGANHRFPECQCFIQQFASLTKLANLHESLDHPFVNCANLGLDSFNRWVQISDLTNLLDPFSHPLGIAESQ